MADPRAARRPGQALASTEATLLVATGSLVLLGLLMVASASIPVSETIYRQPGYLFLKQAIAAVVGVGALGILMRLDYRRWMRYDAALLLGALGLSALTLIPALAPNGLWLRLGPASFQPTEVAKLALIVALAAALARKRDNGDLQSLTAGVLPIRPCRGRFCRATSLPSSSFITSSPGAPWLSSPQRATSSLKPSSQPSPPRDSTST